MLIPDWPVLPDAVDSVTCLEIVIEGVSDGIENDFSRRMKSDSEAA